MKWVVGWSLWMVWLGVWSADLVRFSDCELVVTEWADGDSFRVKLPTGAEMTIRLYGVDCLEIHLAGDESNRRRLRDQRRWFGITNALEARQVGLDARDQVFEWLQEPFVIETSFADGKGDPRYERSYGFVRLADGRDLSEKLVEEGLARAFGVVRSLNETVSGQEWEERLTDLELVAAKRGVGAWARTDWAELPELREELRLEQKELDVMLGLKAEIPPASVNPNTASRDELLAVPGIGDYIALKIIEGRPYTTVDDLLRVPKIGPSTLEGIRPFLKLE